MPIEMLRSVVAPPQDPVDCGSSTLWAEVEAQIGCTLPGDYKRYITAYGSVTFGDFLIPFNPFSANPSMNLIAASHELLACLIHEHRGAPRPRTWRSLHGLIEEAE